MKNKTNFTRKARKLSKRSLLKYIRGIHQHQTNMDHDEVDEMCYLICKSTAEKYIREYKNRRQ